MAENTGIVYLVGAGPGDARLITVRGLDCLRKADVVVFDYLANEALLAHVPRGTERVYVGKQAGNHTMAQLEICKLLADKASQGKKVVRLKGGDPFVFGRGGEEAIYLSERQIPFEIIPGVSSALAVPAYAGIPVTHRSMNLSFHVVTGHDESEVGDPDVEWEALAKTDGTLIFLMGVGNLARITSELMKYGKSPETPVAVIRRGTTPEQETLVSTLEHAVREAKRAAFAPPAVIVIGSVVELRSLIQWYEKKPLFGVRAAVTRPLDQSALLVELLQDAGADVIVTPTIHIQPRPVTEAAEAILREVVSYQWIIFTSGNAVRVFFDYLYSAGKDARALANARIAAIGEKTAEVLISHGIKTDVVPREAVQEGLSQALEIEPGARVLIPRAAAARDVLEDETTRMGAKVTVLPLYDTVGDSEGIGDLRRALTRGFVNLVTFTSSSTVERLAESMKSEDLPKIFEDVKIASIGKITSNTIRSLGLQVHIEAEKGSSESLACAIIDHFRTASADQLESSQVFRRKK